MPTNRSPTHSSEKLPHRHRPTPPPAHPTSALALRLARPTNRLPMLKIACDQPRRDTPWSSAPRANGAAAQSLSTSHAPHSPSAHRPARTLRRSLGPYKRSKGATGGALRTPPPFFFFPPPLFCTPPPTSPRRASVHRPNPLAITRLHTASGPRSSSCRLTTARGHPTAETPQAAVAVPELIAGATF
uniref:Uncharacterized protein n=1 Tax=Setaria viridis TaxID=4556 RepID=A0A4V6D2Z1_SETVI|nr:hypothetical protein SEVIR_8G114800v2 [Setaria viridis]